MVAAISNLVQVFESGVNSWTRAAVAGGDAAFFGSDGSAGPGIDGNLCQFLENAENALVDGDFYSAWTGDFPVRYDLSAVDSQMVVHFRNLAVGFDSIGLIRVALFSGGGTSNYAWWDFAATSTIRNGSFWPLRASGTPSAPPVGSFDNTDISGMAFLVQANGTGLFTQSILIDQVVFHNGPVVQEDALPITQVSRQDYYDLLQPTSGQPYHSLLVAQAGAVIEYGFPISIESENYSDTQPGGIAFKGDDGQGFSNPPDGFYSLNVIGQANGSIVFSDSQFATLSSEFSCTIDGSATNTVINLTTALIATVSDFSCTGAGVTASGVTVSAPSTAVIADGDLAITINDSVAPIDWSADLVAGSTLVTNSDVAIGFAETDLSDINLLFTADNEVTFEPTTSVGTYDLTSAVNTGFTTNFDIPLGNANDTSVEISGTFTATRTDPTTGGGEITIVQPQDTLTIDTNVTALIQIFDFGTQTLLASVTGTTLDYIYAGSPSLTIRVQAVNYSPQKLDISPIGTLTQEFNLVLDNVYEAGSPLTYGVDIAYDRLTKLLTLNVPATVRQVYSSLIDAFIGQISLYNTDFDFQMNGTQSLFLVEDAVFVSDTDANRCTRGGIRYVDSSGTVTNEWFGALSSSSVDTSTFQARYQLEIGINTTNTNALGDVDQVIKVFEQGSFDYRAISPRFKMQPNGFYEADADIHGIYGITVTEPILYAFSLSPVEIPNFTTGDPGITGVALTNYGASPIVREGLNWGASILDSNSNTGENIQRWINYNKSLTGNFIGTTIDTFNIPDFIFGAPYQTIRNEIIGAAGTTLRGLWVERPTEVPHPDFFQQQSDDGTFYVLPVSATAQTVGMLPNSNIYVYNVTKDTVIVNAVLPGQWFLSYSDGNEFSDGDSVLYRICYEDGADYREPIQGTLIASVNGFTIPVSQEDWDPVIAQGVNGSLVDEFTLNVPNIDININDPDGETQKGRLIAWYATQLGSNPDAISLFFGAILVEDEANFRNVTSVADIQLNNVGANIVRFTDTDKRLYRDDDGNIISPGSNSIQIYADKIFVAQGGGGGGDATEANQQQILAELGEIQGAGFDTGNDSLVQIRANQGGGGGDATEANQLIIIDDVADVQTSVDALQADVDLIKNDQGLTSGVNKVITENVENENYTEVTGSVTKTVVKSGNTTTVTRTT